MFSSGLSIGHGFGVSRKWLWHIGGSEWPVFWALCCAVVGYYGAR
jgi:hypothetical protein